MKLVAKTFFGFEEVLKAEIEALGGKKVVAGNRVVEYEGDIELLYKSNLWLRTAISVLVPITHFQFRDKTDLFKKFLRLDLEKYVLPHQTFASKGAVMSRQFTYTKLPMLLFKDAVMDYYRDKGDQLPTVDIARPDILFDIHIRENDCTLSLNSSGAPLFQRGYRKETGEAPLNEAVAAALILKSDWDKKSNLVDPFCGSGTIPIEAGLIANNIPPNIARKTYCFQNWPTYDKDLWEKVYNEAPRVPRRDLDFKIIGSDTDGDVILKARNNMKSLPLGKTVEFKVCDYNDLEPPAGGGTLISNLPYGERLEVEDIGELYMNIGNYFKKKMAGYHCWVLSSDVSALKRIQLKPTAKFQVYNGAISCEYRKYEVFEGTLVEHKYGESRRKTRKAK